MFPPLHGNDAGVAFGRDSGSRRYQIQGKKATEPEYFIALALIYFQIPFIYQYTVYTVGSSGGIEADFLILTSPLATPLWVHGDYWHGGGQRSEDIVEIIQFTSAMEGTTGEGLEVFESEIPSIEDARSWVRNNIL